MLFLSNHINSSKFQAKYYLWASFKPREDKGAVLAEPLDGTGNQQIKK
jgi:hypothetical protein